MKSLFKNKKRATSQKVLAKNVVKAVDEHGDNNHDSDVSFMSMGDGMSMDQAQSDDERPSIVTPRAGDPVVRGPDSYPDEAFYNPTGTSSSPHDLFRLEDTKTKWDPSLDADVQTTAAILVEQMCSNPDDASDITKKTKEDLSEFSDPLGLGILNQASLSLERTDDASSTARRQLKKLARWQAGATMKLTQTGPASPSALDATADILTKLQTGSKHFDPWAYLGTAHSDTNRDQLVAGIPLLDAALEKRRDQLRQLVKENFQRFIGCKGTIDDISLRLRETETVASTSGSTKHVALAAAEAEQAAQEAFAPILKRQAEADAVKQKLVLLQRFEALFRMPGRVRQLAAERDYQGVVTEYSKGKKLIPVQDHGLWKEVARRLEHETAQVCDNLLHEIGDITSSYSAVVKAVQNIELLKAEGLSVAQVSNPLTWFANSQREYLQQRLRHVVERHIETVTSVVAAEASKATKSGQGFDESLLRRGDEDMADPSASCSTVQLAWLDLVQDLTGFFTKELKLLMNLCSSSELVEFYSINQRLNVWEAGVANMRNVLTEVQAHIQQELHSTLQTLWEEADHKLAAHVAALQILGSTRAAVSTFGYWHDDLSILEDVAKAVLSHGVAVLEASVAHWESADDDWEMWRVDLCAASARHPVSAALASVHNGACTAMLQFANLTKLAQSLCNVSVEDVHQRIATAFLDRLRHISSKMRAMLGEVRAEAKEMIKAHHRHGGLFTVEPSYNAASPELTQAVSAFSGHKLSQPMTAPMMALSLLSNTAYLIDHGVMNLTLPRLSLMYPHDAHAQEMCLNQVKQVVETLKGVRDEASDLYVEVQSHLLRASVKHYLTSDGTLWDSMPLRKELRDATFDMAFALVLIVNQVLSHATLSVQAVIVGGVHEMLTVNIRVMSAAGLASLFLEMNFIEGIIPSSFKSDAFDENIEQCYELLLGRLLELVKRKPPTASSALGKVLEDFSGDGSEMDQMESLHACLEAYATKVLPSHAQRANMHFDCFKSLGEPEKGRKKSKQKDQTPVWQQPRPSMSSVPSKRAPTPQNSEMLSNLVLQMTGQLEAIFVEDEDVV